MNTGLTTLTKQIDDIPLARRVGRISTIAESAITVSGLSDVCKIGDVLEVKGGAESLNAEVVSVQSDAVVACPDTRVTDLKLGDLCTCLGPRKVYPSDNWLGRIIDADGAPIDGRGPLPRGGGRTIMNEPIDALHRRGLSAQLATPFAVLNTALPLVEGQRIGLFAGSGVGKSTLLAEFAKGVETDVTVVALIGERGREVREFVENVLGPEGLSKSVVVVATSDQSAVLRRRALYSAMTVAESFRDGGARVLFLADSITRFAEAHREMAGMTGETASLRGFPASTSARIMQLCERAGPGLPQGGSITAVFSVLVAGSDMDEPIADITRGVLDGHIVLSRDIAERGRFPAIDLLKSVSRSVQHALSDGQQNPINRLRQLLGSYEASELMIKAGLYTKGADPILDEAVTKWDRLDKFIGDTSSGHIASDFDTLDALTAGDD